jgi:Tfp pilus assembly protein PilN
MKIPINLASQPFRRDRAMIAASIGVCALLAVTLGVLVLLAMADRTQLADVRGEISRLNSQIRRVANQQAQLDAVVRRPENAEVLERSVFINAVLSRKGISWTRIFEDLEKRVPFNVRIIQIQPTVDPDGRLSLDLNIATQTPGAAIEFLKALENAPFSRPDLHLIQKPTQAEPIFKYRVSVDYVQTL